MRTLFKKSLVKVGYAVVSLFLVSTHAKAETYYFHNDQLGTPQVVTDSQQQVAWKGEYDPFGMVTETVSTVEQNIRFPGQYFDSETELHYNYFRTYDPNTGRYVESDPIGILGGLSTYGYSYQNRIRYFDPTGEIVPAVLVAIAIRGALGAAGGFGVSVGTQVISNGIECFDLSKAFVAAGVSGVIAAINPFASFGPKSAKRLNEIRKISNRNPSHSKTGKQARQVAVETVAAATTGTLISTSANIIYSRTKKLKLFGDHAETDSCNNKDNRCK